MVYQVSLLLLLSQASAHPVTFKGGNAFYATRRHGMVRFEANHTFSRRLSAGAAYANFDLPGADLEAGLAMGSLLAYRRNGKGSQANAYLTLGGGYVLFPDGTGNPAGTGGLQLDFETKRLYTAIMGSSLLMSPFGYNGPTEDLYGVQGRIGMAPYVAEFDQLQAWLVLQAGTTTAEDGFMVSPILRFFYRTVLWELGTSQNGHPWIQLMVHY